MRLLYIETYKLFRQSRTYYAILALFIIEAIVLLSAYYQGAGIIDIVLANLKDTFYFQGKLRKLELRAHGLSRPFDTGTKQVRKRADQMPHVSHLPRCTPSDRKSRAFETSILLHHTQ